MTRPSAQSTPARIAGAALEVLRERGAAGLTMRQVAARAGLALSNVQYHYPSREALLVGLVDHHFAACDEAMERAQARAGEPSLEATLRVSLCDEEVLAAAPVFRELFALARTEPGVRARLRERYRAILKEGIERLAHETADVPRERLAEVVTVLLTAIEGAYLLNDVVEVRGERLAEVLLDVARSMLGQS